MDEVGLPGELADGFEGAAAEEEDALVVVGVEVAFFVVGDAVFGEVFLVVDEVDLHACRGDGADFDDELAIAVVDDEVHAGEADDFMELVFAFVHGAESRGEDADVAASFLDKSG